MLEGFLSLYIESLNYTVREGGDWYLKVTFPTKQPKLQPDWLVLVCVRWWRPHPCLLQCVQLLCHLLHPAAVDQFVKVEVGAAVWALRPLLCQPATDAEVAAQLGTVWTEVSILQLLHTDEAAEHLCQALQSPHRVSTHTMPCYINTWPYNAILTLHHHYHWPQHLSQALQWWQRIRTHAVPYFITS